MLYVLDTDTVIFMLRGLRAPAGQRGRRERALARCREAQAGGDEVDLSAITVSALEFGAYNSADYENEIVAVPSGMSWGNAARLSEPWTC